MSDFNNELATLWVGGHLSYLERLCLTSMVAQGHNISLFSYSCLDDVPPGVVNKDASDIMPIEQLLRHRATSSPALGSNIFRFKLLKLGLGCWVDTDMLFLRKLENVGDYVFGFESKDSINGAILYAPRDSKLIADLLDYVETRPVVPPWWPIRKKLKLHVRNIVGLALPPEELPWGIFGPQALSYFIKKNELEHNAMDAHVFYPIHFSQPNLPFKAEGDLSAHIRPDTIAVHLWNAGLKEFKDNGPPEGSYVWKKCREHGINI